MPQRVKRVKLRSVSRTCMTILKASVFPSEREAICDMGRAFQVRFTPTSSNWSDFRWPSRSTSGIGGYSPPDTSHSRAMVLFGEKMAERLGDGVKTDIFWNVMDFGYAAPDLLAMVECGMLGMCYFSTSYLADRAPELEIVDLPFLFEDSAHAYGALDGALGAHLTERIEAQDGLQEPGLLGQRIPPSLEQRPRREERPEDCRGLRVRLQPNETHVKTFELLGAEPVPVELKEGIAMIESGEVNAQENPLSNTVTYGVTNHQRRITMSGHFYGARALLAHRESFDAWPAQVQEAARACIREAIDHQRKAAQVGGDRDSPEP